ncbi:MAG: DNA-processing protein DprA [Dehalococcoidia bacterium]
MDSARVTEAAEVLRLLDAPSLGPRSVLAMLGQHGSAAAACEALARRVGTLQQQEFVETTSLVEYERAVTATLALGGDFTLWCDETYPPLLDWDGRPPVLFFKGDISGMGMRSLALVGRVDPTDEGREAAARFAARCVSSGIEVISGLAKGIDGASHQGAIAAGGRTFAVLGHGLDYAYPKENAGLYKAIPENGALISQFRTGFGPQRWTFPARNEVMCTLASGTVIIEGKTGCGSLIQADFSFKHGRPVFLLSRNLEVADNAWAHGLVARGAHVVQRFEDVLAVLDAEKPAPPPPPPVQAGFRFDDMGDDVSDGDAHRALTVWDIDGVIADTRHATAVALAALATKHTGVSVPASEISVGGAPHKALERLGVANAYQVYQSGYDAAFAEARGEVRMFGGVVDLLRALKTDGVGIAAVTAQPKRRADLMLPPDVRGLFDAFYCYNDTRGRKEDGIRMAISALGSSTTETVYIGDTPDDLRAARRADVRGVGVLWGFSTHADLMGEPHEALATSPEHLSEVLASLRHA